MKQIFHPWDLWEDHKNGFYDNCSGPKKEHYLKKCIEMFNSEKLTKTFMLRVISEWKFSCEHNLTNPSMNKIAYIGQAACCIYCGAPNTVTMKSWNMLNDDVREISNNIAKNILEKYFKENNYE